MYRITYQKSLFGEMMPMGYAEWKECLGLAAPIVQQVRNEHRAYLQTGDASHKEKADEMKRTLPAACFQASDFDVSTGTAKYNKGKRGRWREQVHAYLSGLFVIDVDHCGDPRTIFNRIQAEHDLSARGILLMYVSPKGEGMKIIAKCRAEWGNLICNQYEMASLLGLLDYVDDACKDSSRLSFLTGMDDVLYIDEKELFNTSNK